MAQLKKIAIPGIIAALLLVVASSLSSCNDRYRYVSPLVGHWYASYTEFGDIHNDFYYDEYHLYSDGTGSYCYYDDYHVWRTMTFRWE